MKRDSIDWKIIDRETISRGGGSMEDRSRRGWGKYMAGSNRQACIRGGSWRRRISRGVENSSSEKSCSKEARWLVEYRRRQRGKVARKVWHRLNQTFLSPSFFGFIPKENPWTSIASCVSMDTRGGKVKISIYISLIRGREALFKSSCFLLIFLYG